MALVCPTLKEYMAAITTNYDTVDDRSLGKHNLIVSFLRGAERINPGGLPGSTERSV